MTIAKKDILLPTGVQAVGLSEDQVAHLWGISPSQFAELKRNNPELLPRPRRLGNRKVYSWIESVETFHNLPFWDDDGAAGLDNEWGVD
jgi:predicted DNA-binding transcriptional regulator AlpA